MRGAWVSLMVLALGCGSTDNTGSGGSTAASSGTITGSGQSSSAAGGLCIPGQQIACGCPGGAQTGAQACLPGGTGYGPCEGCGGSGSTSSGQSGASSGSSSSSSGGGGSGGAPPQCMAPSDCGPSTECKGWSCTAGKCGTVYAKDGTKLASQVPGDCADLVCDGNGGSKTIADAADIQDDANACTTDACSAQGPTHTPEPIGTVCPTGLCSGAATCVAFIPVQCKIGNTVYQGCDGFFHQNLIMSFTKTDQTIGLCNGAPSDVGYCPPGGLCSATVNGVDMGFGKCQ